MADKTPYLDNHETVAAQGRAVVDTADAGDASLYSQTTLLAEPTANDVPPPAYGDFYGEIRDEKHGSSTTAHVTDDGRVNIRINQLNRRFSQIFTPALRPPTSDAQEYEKPSTAQIPPSLAGKYGIPPPRLNVVIQVVGSRGDVQPFVALGKVLKRTYGHRVRLATHPRFKVFVQEHDLEFFSIGGDPSRLMSYMVKNPGLMPGFRSLFGGDVARRREDVAEYIQGCWRSCYQAGDGMDHQYKDDSSSKHSVAGPAAKPFVADCIIANPPSFAHIHCAEKLGIPLHIMFTMPYSPTQAFPHPLANIQSTNADPLVSNYISYAMIEVLSWQGLGDIINRFREKCLALDPVSSIWAPGMLQRLKIPHTYCWSPALIPKPRDWGSHVSLAGFYMLSSDYTPSPALQAFLNAGPPPVYIGFGSIVLEDPDAMTRLILQATKKCGQRILLSKGWGGIGADDGELSVPDDVFLLGNVPHDWLFEHVSCVVHHGGAGTTAAGITAGRPTVIVPFFGDQPFWGAMVAKAGAGPNPIPQKQLTADNLAEAIIFCLQPESVERARKLAATIGAENGTDTGAVLFHHHLDVDRLRCTLRPSRPAAWRIRRSKIRLSAFAACTLANANLLDFQDLKLYRPQEYYTDEGPVDPISGGFTTCCRAISDMALGLVETPTETVKALQMPFKASRKRSVTSPNTRAEGTASPIGSTASPPSRRSRTSFSGQRSLTSSKDERTVSDRSSTTLGIETSRPAVMSDGSSEQHVPRDALRHTGAHVSKGIGRSLKALVLSPVEISSSLTRGSHNVPKLWGDDSVRPQARVTDFRSSMRALGKDFGYGWYDGITGLVTQPWNGAQKEGTAGFFKGVGRGIIGFPTKPLAGCLGIMSYPMKGAHKELQKMFGGNVQSYIVASRTAQGYDEWLQSSDAEKQEVIERWKLIQKYLKRKKYDTDEMMRDVLATRQVPTNSDTEVRTGVGDPAEPIYTWGGLSVPYQDDASSIFTIGDRQTPPRSPSLHMDEAREVGAKRQSLRRKPVPQHSSLQGVYDENEADRDELHHALTSSEADAERHAREAGEYRDQLKRAMERSLQDQEQDYRTVHDGEGKVVRSGEEANRPSRECPSSSRQPCTYDQGHLAGATQSEFITARGGGKTAQEMTEEEIVLEYIRKQSLLEVQHRRNGMRATDDEDDEELQSALRASMHEASH